MKKSTICGRRPYGGDSQVSYSGVADHESVRLTTFLAEVNDSTVRAADIGNAYSHGTTREKVYTVTGKEFGEEFAGQAMVTVKNIYDVTTSAAR